MSEKKSDKKRALILDGAKQVFIRKGFSKTTMKDIIEACGISRGGIYLYYHSVAEIFMQVIYRHNAQKLKETQDRIAEDKSFREVVEDYFDKQKNRLLNMKNSLLMAMYEYRFDHKDDYDKEFFLNEFLNIKAPILEILSYGVRQGEIRDCGIEDMAMNIMFCIEGISMLAVTSSLSEDIINSQFAFAKNMIFNMKP